MPMWSRKEVKRGQTRPLCSRRGGQMQTVQLETTNEELEGNMLAICSTMDVWT